MQKIATALVKAQKAFGPVLKNKENPHLRAEYANLSAVLDAVVKSLNDSGVFLMQQTHESVDGVVVETIFIHESGEQLSAGKLFVPATKKDAQGFGSAMSYARRYSLKAACGISEDDDDGQAASTEAVKKAPITNERLTNAISQIKAGKYTTDKLRATFALDPEQDRALVEALANA